MDNTFKQISEQISKEAAEKGAANPDSKNPPSTQGAAAVDFSKVSDEDLMKIIAERKITVPTAEQPKQKTPEEIQAEQEAEDFAVMKYGIEKMGKKKEVLLKPSELKGKDDKDLVWEDFVAKAKEKNPKISDETILSRFNKEYHIVTDAEFPEYEEDEVQWGKDKLKGQAELIRKRASKDIDEVREAYNNEKTKQTVYNESLKEAEKYIKGNKTFKFKLGDYTLDYTLSEEQQKVLTDSLAYTMFNAKTNYAGQDIKLEEQALFQAKSQTLDDVVNLIVARERDLAKAEALKPFTNRVPYQSQPTDGSATNSIDALVLESLNKLPNMGGSRKR